MRGFDLPSFLTGLLVGMFVGMLVLHLLALPANAAVASCPESTLTGIVERVIDGDTIIVAGVRVRLQGLAAPELREAGGRDAALMMNRLTADHLVRCELDGTRSHERCVGVCWIGARDIGELMVMSGLAKDCPAYSGGRYGMAEHLSGGPHYPVPQYCRTR